MKSQSNGKDNGEIIRRFLDGGYEKRIWKAQQKEFVLPKQERFMTLMDLAVRQVFGARESKEDKKCQKTGLMQQ